MKTLSGDVLIGLRGLKRLTAVQAAWRKTGVREGNSWSHKRGG